MVKGMGQVVLGCAVLATLAGCAPGGDTAERGADTPRSTVFDTQLQGLERAEAVEGTLMEADAQRRRALGDP